MICCCNRRIVLQFSMERSEIESGKTAVLYYSHCCARSALSFSLLAPRGFVTRVSPTLEWTPQENRRESKRTERVERFEGHTTLDRLGSSRTGTVAQSDLCCKRPLRRCATSRQTAKCPHPARRLPHDAPERATEDQVQSPLPAVRSWGTWLAAHCSVKPLPLGRRGSVGTLSEVETNASDTCSELTDVR
jgi:hypothetical protein